MATRTERRAAEHQARKLAYKQSRQLSTLVPDNEPVHISEAQLIANRENAKQSTGPVTSIGKLISSANALKHGLTGQTVLLPTDDADEYHRRHDAALEFFQPATEEELRLLQSITDSFWRLDRLRRIETGIFFKGHIEFANKFEDQSECRRNQLIETETYLKYEKTIRNLHIQEARLNRRIEKEQAELFRLQTIRKREERTVAEKISTSKPASQNGFDFSTTNDNRNSAASHQSGSVEQALVPAHLPASV